MGPRLPSQRVLSTRERNRGLFTPARLATPSPAAPPGGRGALGPRVVRPRAGGDPERREWTAAGGRGETSRCTQGCGPRRRRLGPRTGRPGTVEEGPSLRRRGSPFEGRRRVAARGRPGSQDEEAPAAAEGRRAVPRGLSSPQTWWTCPSSPGLIIPRPPFYSDPQPHSLRLGRLFVHFPHGRHRPTALPGLQVQQSSPASAG